MRARAPWRRSPGCRPACGRSTPAGRRARRGRSATSPGLDALGGPRSTPDLDAERRRTRDAGGERARAVRRHVRPAARRATSSPPSTCATSSALDRVLLVVNDQPWQKLGTRDITPAEDRFAMVEAAVGSVDGLEASRLEIDRGGLSFTADTLHDAAGRGPGPRAVRGARQRRRRRAADVGAGRRGADAGHHRRRRAARARREPSRRRAGRGGASRCPGSRCRAPTCGPGSPTGGRSTTC